MIWLSKLFLLIRGMISSLPWEFIMNASIGSVSNYFIKDSPCFRQTKESSSRGYIKGLCKILAGIVQNPC